MHSESSARTRNRLALQTTKRGSVTRAFVTNFFILRNTCRTKKVNCRSSKIESFSCLPNRASVSYQSVPFDSGRPLAQRFRLDQPRIPSSSPHATRHLAVGVSTRSREQQARCPSWRCAHKVGEGGARQDISNHPALVTASRAHSRSHSSVFRRTAIGSGIPSLSRLSLWPCNMSRGKVAKVVQSLASTRPTAPEPTSLIESSAANSRRPSSD